MGKPTRPTMRGLVALLVLAGRLAGRPALVSGRGDEGDANPECTAWADSGECDANPIYSARESSRASATLPAIVRIPLQLRLRWAADEHPLSSIPPSLPRSPRPPPRPGAVLRECPAACRAASQRGESTADEFEQCLGWAEQGECARNPMCVPRRRRLRAAVAAAPDHAASIQTRTQNLLPRLTVSRSGPSRPNPAVCTGTCCARAPSRAAGSARPRTRP